MLPVITYGEVTWSCLKNLERERWSESYRKEQVKMHAALSESSARLRKFHIQRPCASVAKIPRPAPAGWNEKQDTEPNSACSTIRLLTLLLMGTPNWGVRIVYLPYQTEDYGAKAMLAVLLAAIFVFFTRMLFGSAIPLASSVLPICKIAMTPHWKVCKADLSTLLARLTSKTYARTNKKSILSTKWLWNLKSELGRKT